MKTNSKSSNSRAGISIAGESEKTLENELYAQASTIEFISQGNELLKRLFSRQTSGEDEKDDDLVILPKALRKNPAEKKRKHAIFAWFQNLERKFQKYISPKKKKNF